MRANLPVTTLGTYDSKLQSRGLHLPSDNLSRVQMVRLPEGVEIVAQFIRSVDRGEVSL